MILVGREEGGGDIIVYNHTHLVLCSILPLWAATWPCVGAVPQYLSPRPVYQHPAQGTWTYGQPVTQLWSVCVVCVRSVCVVCVCVCGVCAECVCVVCVWGVCVCGVCAECVWSVCVCVWCVCGVCVWSVCVECVCMVGDIGYVLERF